MDLSVSGCRQVRKHVRLPPVADINARAGKRFLGNALNGLKDWEKSTVVNTDKAPTCGISLSELKAEGKGPKELLHLQVKYLNNGIEVNQAS